VFPFATNRLDSFSFIRRNGIIAPLTPYFIAQERHITVLYPTRPSGPNVMMTAHSVSFELEPLTVSDEALPMLF
jgi:hypothetical protein